MHDPYFPCPQTVLAAYCIPLNLVSFLLFVTSFVPCYIRVQFLLLLEGQYSQHYLLWINDRRDKNTGPCILVMVKAGFAWSRDWKWCPFPFFILGILAGGGENKWVAKPSPYFSKYLLCFCSVSLLHAAVAAECILLHQYEFSPRCLWWYHCHFEFLLRKLSRATIFLFNLQTCLVCQAFKTLLLSYQKREEYKTDFFNITNFEYGKNDTTMFSFRHTNFKFKSPLLISQGVWFYQPFLPPVSFLCYM